MTSTMPISRSRREGAGKARPRVHGPRAAIAALQRHVGPSLTPFGAKGRIRRAFETIDALVEESQRDLMLRDYLLRRFTPMCARLHADHDADLMALIDAKGAAEGPSDLCLQRLAADPGDPQRRRQAIAALALEQRTGGQLLAELGTKSW